MKKLLIFSFALSLALILIGTAEATPVTATLTADNHYALYFGDETGVTFVDRNEVGVAGAPGTYNWSMAESFNFEVEKGDYIYLAGWSDNSVAQGWIGQFDCGSSMLLSNTTDWEVHLTFSDLDTNDPAPTEVELQTEIASASWVTVSDSISHGDGPWGMISGISNAAEWIWGSELLPGSNYGEHQIFRTQIPEPSVLLLIGTGLLGLAGLRRKFRE